MEKMRIEKIQPNMHNPYKYNEDEMKTLMESIKEYGILQPLLVRKNEDERVELYTIISGHRRFLAASRLGIKELPVDVLNISKDEADILLVDSNLHRENISISEKAFAYKLKLDAMKRQGERTDLTSTQVVEKLFEADNLSASRLGQETGESREQVRRYIRLTNLNRELLNLTDNGKIAFTVAVELSYLSKDEQAILYETIQSEDCTPSLSQAQEMKKLSQSGELSSDKMLGIMIKPKANQKEMFKMPMEKVKAFEPKIASAKEAEDFITKACDYYAKYLKRQRDRGDR